MNMQHEEKARKGLRKLLVTFFIMGLGSSGAVLCLIQDALGKEGWV